MSVDWQQFSHNVSRIFSLAVCELYLCLCVPLVSVGHKLSWLIMATNELEMALTSPPSRPEDTHIHTHTHGAYLLTIRRI